nr:MAG: hypothetical protein [Bacteriophage sp.]
MATVPKYKQDGIGLFWMMKDIYTGPNGTGEYVPNVGDAILDWTAGWFKVISVVDNIATWVSWEAPSNNTSEEDVMFGTVPAVPGQSSRVWYNTSVTPYSLDFDARLRIYGSGLTHFKIFKGTDISATTGKVIGYTIDTGGAKDSENIPFELVGTDTITNIAIWVGVTAYTSEALTDGDTVTAVYYKGEIPAGYQTFIIKDSSLVRTGSASQKAIRSLVLNSAFLSDSADKQFDVPMGTTIDSLGITGVITYSDGSTRTLTPDGSKLTIAGFDDFAAMVIGQRINVVATYYLDSTEQSDIVQTNGTRNFITTTYSAVVTEADGAATVKLFVVPKWVSDSVGYSLDYWLYRLDRQDFYYVTPFVQMGTNSADFQPKLYGTRQRLTVVIDLNNVSTTYKEIRHSQTFEITLARDGLSAGDPWFLRWTVGQNPAYGQGVSAKFKFGSVGNWGLKVDCGAATYNQWLDALYYRCQPLYYPGTETKAPAPTHFNVYVSNTYQVEYPISQWNQELTFQSGGVEGQSVVIQWIYRDGTTGNALYLGASPMVIRHVTDYSDGTSLTS